MYQWKRKGSLSRALNRSRAGMASAVAAGGDRDRPPTVGVLSPSTLSTIALTDPPEIGQTDPVIGAGARGAVGRNSVGAADRPSGSTRLSG